MEHTRLSQYVKAMRKQYNLTQIELSEKSGGYKELTNGEKDFHKACSKKIFGTPMVPELPYTRENLTDLAKQVIRSQTTLTGVSCRYRQKMPIFK